MTKQNVKLERLKDILRQMESILVAYSGGVDSALLLKVACDTLGDKVLAVTADSPTYPAQELDFAQKIAARLGVRHKIIKTQELKDKNFIANPVNRCYFCKGELFGRLKKIARQAQLSFVVDASNIDDKKDYRPGNMAKKELNIRSPLQEAGLTKVDIRRLSKRLGLITWDKPSLACLASRVAYGIRISPGLLARIEQAETYLKRLGFRQVRLRHYNGLCRIEVLKEDVSRLIDRREKIAKKLKGLGYNYITVDLEGYRSGSLNEVIKR